MIKVYVGDNRETLKNLADESVHTCITSPPYWGLRDYGTGEWEGGDENCDHIDRAKQGGGVDSKKQRTSAGTMWQVWCNQKRQSTRVRRNARRVCRELG